MTRNEVIARAREQFDAGNLIEAGFTIKMLSTVPDNLDPKIIRAARAAFFLGAEYMLKTMTMPQDVGVWGDEEVCKMVQDIKKELGTFYHSYPDKATH